MPWYEWVFTYMIIIGAIVWMIIPERTLFFTSITLGTAVLGYVLLKYYDKFLIKKKES